jgi:hypothetical protein
MMAESQMVKRTFLGALSLVFMLWMFGGCGQRDTPPSEWVVQVGTQRVSTVSFQREWERRQALQERPLQPVDVIGGVVSDWQAYLAASSLGIMDDPELQLAIRKVVANRAREVLSKKLSKPEWESSVGPEEIEAGYRGQASRWEKPAAWNLAWLVASVSPKAQSDRRVAVRDRVEEYRKQVLASGDPKATFAVLCSQHSDDAATRYLGGELGWLTHEQLASRLGADGLKGLAGLAATNRLSSLIETSNRMTLLFLIGHRPVQMRPLDEVAPQIRSEIERGRDAAQKKALEQELYRLVPVKTNLAALSGITRPSPPTNRPAAPSPMPKP